MTRIEDVLARDRASQLPEPPPIERTVDAVLTRLRSDDEKISLQPGSELWGKNPGIVGVMPCYSFGVIPWTVA